MTTTTTGRKGTTRACERCRKSRVRCLVETLEVYGKCKRCHQANAECIFRPDTKPQQQRKRADARIASLESRLSAFTASLEQKLAAQRPSLNTTTSSQDALDEALASGSPRRNSSHTSDSPHSSDEADEDDNHVSLPVHQLCRKPPKKSSDAVPGYLESTMLSIVEAKELFSYFTDYVLSENPLLALNHSDTFESLRETRPLFLFAIVTAATRGKYPDKFELLHQRLQRIVLEETMLGGQKSLEWIQIILLLEIWYCVPDDINRLNFYQWIHLAGAMSLHIGLIGAASASTLSDDERNTVTDHQKQIWRTGLAVCMATSTVSISLHRQAMFTVSKHAQNFLDALEACATTANDLRIVAWGKLQILLEKAETIKTKYDDASVKATLWIEIQSLEGHFEAWRHELAPGILNFSLEIHYYYCRCRLYELFMLDGELSTVVPSNTSRLSPVTSTPGLGMPSKITPALIRTVTSVVQSCHDILNRFCQLDIWIYPYLPTVTTMRSLYALNTLSTLRNLSKKPQHAASVIVDENTLLFETYLNRLKRFLKKIIDRNPAHKVAKLVYNTLDRVAQQPYVTQHGTPGSQQIKQGNDTPSGLNEPHNDFEAVVVSTVSKEHHTAELSPPHILVQALAASTTTHPPIDESFIAPSQVFGDSMNVADLQWLDNMNLDSSYVGDFDMMCMPDLVTGANSWFHAGNYQDSQLTNSLTPATNTAAFPAWTPQL